MNKILLGGIIVVFGGFCGYLCSKKLRKRAVFFRQFYDFNERFLNEIAYYRRPITEFIGEYRYRGEFDELIEIYLKNLANQEIFFRP